MTAVVQFEAVFKHCPSCKANYTRGQWNRLELESSRCAPNGITVLGPILDCNGHVVIPARIAVWKQCPSPCRNTLVALEER